MMTSRERVLITMAHEQPDRVPVWCGPSVEFWEKCKRELALDDEGVRLCFGDDFRRVFARYAGPELTVTHPNATYKTVFGIEREGYGYGQPLSHPLANASLNEIHEYAWPDPAWVDPSNLRADAAPYRERFAILGGDWSPFWHDAIDLLGMENMMLRMYTHPELVDAVLTHLVDYYAGANERIFAEAADLIDIMFIGNDFGSMNGPLLGPELYQRYITPQLRRLTEIGHACGKPVMMHCCGGIAELIPAMIEAGVDGLHAVQPCCRGMNLQRLKEEYGRKLVFNGAIDSNYVLIQGTPETVREQTRQVLEIMMPGGGFIAGASHDTILEMTPVENVRAMFDAVREFGNYA